MEVYLPLNLKNEQARKLYIISRNRRCTVIKLVEEIVNEYVNSVAQFNKEVLTSSSDSTNIKNIQISQRRLVGERIAMLRQVNNLSQKALGESIGLGQQWMSQIELGNRRLDILEAAAIAQVLGVELSEIVSNS